MIGSSSMLIMLGVYDMMDMMNEVAGCIARKGVRDDYHSTPSKD